MDLWWENWSSRPERRDEVDETDRPGLPRMMKVALTLLACAGLTYVLPFLSDYRPWIPGEPVPLLRLFTFEDGSSATGAAPGIGGGYENLSGERARESLASELGEVLAANLGDGSGADGSKAVSVNVSVDPAELKGLVMEIEDPSGEAMRPFYEALKRTAEGRAGAVTRIAHWGDSTIAADDITSTLRRRLQKRFGDAGHGFVLTAKGSMPYRHKDLKFKGKGWKLSQMIRGKRRDGRYGYGGVSFGSWGGGRGTYGTVDEGPIGTKVGRFELFYFARKGGGDLELKVDDGEPTVLSTSAAEAGDRWHSIDLDDGPHELSIRAMGHGEVRMYGVVMERPGPGVVYDSLGIVGARAARLLNADADHFAAQVRHRDPDLLILAFGGNEAGDRRMSSKWYEKNLTEVVQFVRRGKPQAACMLMAPLDQGEVDKRGKVRTIPVLKRIVKVQRKVALAQGCAFFDTFNAMGGPGAMGRWYRSKPRLGWGDFRHATPAGYEVIGNLFYKALLKGFADYLEHGAMDPGEGKAPVAH